jgi:hypothetical protein
MSQKILNIKIKALRVAIILLFTLTILITLLISPISEWLMSLGRDTVISFNVAMLFIWSLVCLILSFATKICDRPAVMTSFTILLGLVFHSSQLIEIYAGNVVRSWHQYYLIRSAESVVVNHNISELPRIFDNYVSSPASPILGAILSIILDLNPITAMMFGLVYIAIIVLSLVNIAKTIMKEKAESKGHFSIFIIVAMYFITTNVGLIGSYVPASLALFSLVIFLLIKLADRNTAASRAFISSRLLTLVLLCCSALLYFLPLTFLMSILLLIGSLVSKMPVYIKRISLILFTIAFAYFVYAGFSFYDDFRAYINWLVESFKPEPFIVWSESAAERLDPIFQILLWLTRGYPLTLIFILAGLLYACNAKPPLRFLALFGIVGVGGAIVTKFFHSLSDYAIRLNSLALLATPLGLYYGTRLMKMISGKLNLRPTTTRVFASLLIAIILLTSISGWFFTGLMYPASPKSASDYHYNMRETFETSMHIGNALKYLSNALVSANWRYGYLQSIYGIELSWSYSTIVDFYTSKRTTIIVLSELSKDFPDYSSPPLRDEKWNRLHESFNIIYMSSHSRVFMMGG